MRPNIQFYLQAATRSFCVLMTRRCYFGVFLGLAAVIQKAVIQKGTGRVLWVPFKPVFSPSLIEGRLKVTKHGQIPFFLLFFPAPALSAAFWRRLAPLVGSNIQRVGSNQGSFAAKERVCAKNKPCSSMRSLRSFAAKRLDVGL